ncbi:PH domain-containing protein [Lysinibacter sp. HNR]|uniref:PH domain-containing protein n=1 Tax=Lysinibacter sp. HNR TaxID=3031408 RepID=UPI0024351BA4|nr:PH domain-containing protein [Lysinibacter sp. HNR]WGD38048.1 PH domain-containing protein [Lysinibacter sp. HNR]
MASVPNADTGSAEYRAANLEAALKPATAAHVRPEIVLARLRRHGRRLFLPAIVLLVVAPLAGFYGSWFREQWQQLSVLGGAALVILLLCLLPYLAWLGTTFTITTKRIIIRHGVIVRSRSEVSLGRIREVQLRSNAIQRLYRSGTIHLAVGSDSVLKLNDVPQAELVVSMLHELIERSYAAETTLPTAYPSDNHVSSTVNN